MSTNDPPEFDINKVASEFMQKNIEGFVKLGTGIFKVSLGLVEVENPC
jgi:hypothetical protein